MNELFYMDVKKYEKISKIYFFYLKRENAFFFLFQENWIWKFMNSLLVYAQSRFSQKQRFKQ